MLKRIVMSFQTKPIIWKELTVLVTTNKSPKSCKNWKKGSFIWVQINSCYCCFLLQAQTSLPLFISWTFIIQKYTTKKYTLKENKWFSHSLQTISTEIFIQY